MMSPYEEECLVKMPGRLVESNSLPAVAMFKTMTEHEFFGDQGGHPSIHEGNCFIHEGRRTVPEIHGDDFPERLYPYDGFFALEFEEA